MISLGLKFNSPFLSHMGYAELARDIVTLASNYNIPVKAIEIPMQQSNVDFGEKGRLVDTAKLYDGPLSHNVINMVPLPQFFEKYRSNNLKNIGYTTFEADRIPTEWVAQCNKMETIWVPSEWNINVFRDSGVTKPIFHVGPVMERKPLPINTSNKFRFLSIFQWNARKNPTALLRAFLSGFDGRDDVVLTLKTHTSPDESVSQGEINRFVSDILGGLKLNKRPSIEIITKLLSNDKIDDLYKKSNAYVSLSHGEGLGLPIWKAIEYGIPVIHTGWSAPAVILGEKYPFLVRHNMSPIYEMAKFVPFFDSSMSWAEPHLDDAIDKMRYVVSNYKATWEDFQAHSLSISEEYTEQKCGARLQAGLM